MYRMAEKKSELSGKVSRVLKETSIDCLLNENQKKLSQNKLNLKRKLKSQNLKLKETMLQKLFFLISI